MKVRDLISRLSNLDPDLELVSYTFCQGVVEPCAIDSVRLDTVRVGVEEGVRYFTSDRSRGLEALEVGVIEVKVPWDEILGRREARRYEESKREREQFNRDNPIDAWFEQENH